MFKHLEVLISRPKPFEFYSAADLWTDKHTSEQMLAYHLNAEIGLSSRRGRFIDNSVAWIGSHFNIDKGTRIADFGCGPGLYASRLARYGARVTGIDFSELSINYARNEAEQLGLSIEYIHQNYLEYCTEDRFNVIMMIMCDFCALSPSQRMTMLTKFKSLLLPGGSVLLDVYSLNAFNQRTEATSFEENLLNGFWSPDRYYGFLNTYKYDDAKVVLDKYTIVEAERTRTVYNWFQYFSSGSLLNEFKVAGFVQNELYGNVAGAPFDETAPEFAIVAQVP
jgi:2-polyprenyl-3-methyl-5-hydroxy-6-metoxy-1,4-benzoquinol methylase